MGSHRTQEGGSLPGLQREQQPPSGGSTGLVSLDFPGRQFHSLPCQTQFEKQSIKAGCGMLTEVENQSPGQCPSLGVNGWARESADGAGEEAAPGQTDGGHQPSYLPSHLRAGACALPS